MSSIRRLALVLILVLVCVWPVAGQVTVTPYLWFTPWVASSSATNTTLITRLRATVQQALDRGNCLTPAAMAHFDNAFAEKYWIYMEPGRIVEQFARAYAYLPPAQQSAVATYVATELASATCAPWATSPMTPAVGSVRREFHPKTRLEFNVVGSEFNNRPEVEGIYGVWLWCWLRNDYTLCNTYQSQIRTMYTARSGQGNIYATMGAHIAKARLERVWGNSANEAAATALLQTALNDGLTFSTIDARVSTSPGYWSNQQTGQYTGWAFYGLAPEIARYIGTDGETITAALTRHATGLADYPFWWMLNAPYDGRMTGVFGGAEAGGLTSEMHCMLARMERYAVGASAATMHKYARSGASVYGDWCQWETLILAIEASGDPIEWVDVRNGVPDDEAEPAVPPARARRLLRIKE